MLDDNSLRIDFNCSAVYEVEDDIRDQEQPHRDKW